MRHEEVSYTCDGCNREDEAKFRTDGNDEQFTLPDGWVRMEVKGPAGDQPRVKVRGEVCSRECAIKLLQKGWA